jgi:uncharacterized protein (DUF111 family)
MRSSPPLRGGSPDHAVGGVDYHLSEDSPSLIFIETISLGVRRWRWTRLKRLHRWVRAAEVHHDQT